MQNVTPNASDRAKLHNCAIFTEANDGRVARERVDGSNVLTPFSATILGLCFSFDHFSGSPEVRDICKQFQERFGIDTASQKNINTSRMLNKIDRALKWRLQFIDEERVRDATYFGDFMKTLKRRGADSLPIETNIKSWLANILDLQRKPVPVSSKIRSNPTTTSKALYGDIKSKLFGSGRVQMFPSEQTFKKMLRCNPKFKYKADNARIVPHTLSL